MKITLDKINRDVVKAVDFYNNPALTCYTDIDNKDHIHILIDGEQIPYSISNFFGDCSEIKKYYGKKYKKSDLYISDLSRIVCIRWCIKRRDKRKREIIKVFNDMLNYVSRLNYKSYF